MIKVNVEVNNKSWHKKIKNPKKYFNKKLKKISKIVKFFKGKNVTFTILLTNSLNIKKLNNKFRKRNRPTDVLSFPSFSLKSLKLLKEKKIYIGDIAVSYEIINSRAEKNFFLEFDKVWIHGLLHLLGYNHIRNKDYFIDPTISNQGIDAEEIFTPDYGYGLILDDNTTALTKFEKPDYGKANITETFIIDSIGGSTRLKVETVYTGSKADNTRAEFNANGLSSIQKSYLDFYSLAYNDIEVAQDMYFKDDRNQKNTFTVYEEYVIPNHWAAMPEDPEQIYSEYYALAIDNFMFPQKTAKRKSPYYINESTNVDYNIVIFTPEIWSIKPDYYKSDNPYFEYTYTTKYSNARIDLIHKYKALSDHVPAEDYSEFLKAHEKASENISYYLTYNTGMAQSLAATGDSDISWFAVILFLVVFTGVGFLCRLIYTNYDIPSKAHPDDHRPIGGWLVLIAIGLCISPILSFFPMISNDYFTSNYFSLWSTGNEALVLLVFFEVIFNAASIAFNILILIIFFKRRSIAPRLIIAFYAFNLIGLSIDALAASTIPSIQSITATADIYSEVLKSLISCLIWIPYFIYSERVKDTFVNTYKKHNTAANEIENMDLIKD